MCDKLYHEKQIKAHCTIHATNAFIGRQAVDCKQLLEYIAKNKALDRIRKEVYSEEKGFVPDVVFAYARRFGVYLEHAKSWNSPGSKAQFLSAVGIADRAILSQNGHSVAIIRSPPAAARTKSATETKLATETKSGPTATSKVTWCLVDSLHKKPQRIGTKSIPWTRIYGALYTDVGRDAFDRLQALKKTPIQLPDLS
jgi:hypothetical protein